MDMVKAALRAVVRERPEIADLLLRELLGGALESGSTLEPEVASDEWVALDPAVDPDFVARVGRGELLHLEFQGYPDLGFVDRLFRQHLSLVLRYPERAVGTVAVWLIRPPHAQRIEVIRRERVMVHVASVVLSQVKASRLLAREETACFAAGADAEGWSHDELSDLVVAALGRLRSSLSLRVAAIALASTCGRYDAMVRAFGAVDRS